MNWNNFNTYGSNPSDAFETLCNQLFERYLKRVHKNDWTKIRIVNGEAGDGGVEAYGQLKDGKIIALQSKWFRGVLDIGQFRQIKDSINMAMSLRPEIEKYIICIPRDINSLKFGRGKQNEPKKPIENHEDKAVETFVNEMKDNHPQLEIEWWFDHNLTLELAESSNEGIQKFWFEKELVSLGYLERLFALGKQGWLQSRYIPELHAQGVIHQTVEELNFSEEFRTSLEDELTEHVDILEEASRNIISFKNSVMCTGSLGNLMATLLEKIDLELVNLREMMNEVNIGNDLYKPIEVSRFDVLPLLKEIRELVQKNGQYGILVKVAEAVNKYQQFKDIDLSTSFFPSIKLILGEPGAGKTHGLANAVDQHILKSAPAIIIQAKGADITSWSTLLSTALSLPDWSLDDILSSLQALAVRCDHQKVKELAKNTELESEQTKVLICIDGLEEDIGKESIWYARIRQATLLSTEYPRTKFMFSARSYFHRPKEDPKDNSFAVVSLPKEGDVPVWSVAEEYFSEKHFNIKVDQIDRVRGIDSLFALRLFCEQYKNRTVSKEDVILTAAHELLQLKIERMEEIFKDAHFASISGGSTPVFDSLIAVSSEFYKEKQLKYEELNSIIKSTVGDYFSGYGALIDFLVNNGLLIRDEVTMKIAGLNKKISVYSMINNSAIELIIATRIAEELSSGELAKIPEVYIEESQDGENSSAELILQAVVDRLFIGENKLIGDITFPSGGIDKEKIGQLRLSALIHANSSQYTAYRNEVKKLLLSPGFRQYDVLVHLILPSSRFNKNVFGAIFLHQVLMKQKNVFERDKQWSGQDDYERSITKNKDRKNSVKDALVDFFGKELQLSPFSLHDETPLIFAWGLSSIDQDLRDRLRNSLSTWALKQPLEFQKLLGLIFKCDDPQIHEDLASIMIALAGNLKDKTAINSLAKWSIKYVFKKKTQYRNVIIRQGMRAIVERAYQYNLIKKSEVEICRPVNTDDHILIPLDTFSIANQSEQIYPIVHDLAWYVIPKAYESFLEYPAEEEGGEVTDNDTPKARALLDKFRKQVNTADLYAHSWAMAAAIGYIRGLGFSRAKGNGTTEASHGSKSRVFTYEEKYTWLAVHYLQGYLSDYMPKNEYGQEELINDYSILSPIPNPAESKSFQKEFNQNIYSPHWIIKGSLVAEKGENENIDTFIKDSIEAEPIFNFEEWIEYNVSDFYRSPLNAEMIALYNDTTVHDSNELIMARIKVWAAIMEQDHIEDLKDPIKQLPFANHLESLEASPDTHIYSNPSDLIWMDWLKETQTETEYISSDGKESSIINCVTSVTHESVDGERYLMIPSKEIRKSINISEYRGNQFLNDEGNLLGIHHVKKDRKHNSQELLVVDKIALLNALREKNQELIWFVEYFQRTNVHNTYLGKIEHQQKVRKYMVRSRNGCFETIKFWDKRSSN